MARPIWSGSLSFGLVNVPVHLYSALRDRDVHFRQLHETDGSPIQTRRYCKDEDVEVPFEELAHGFDREDGDQVILTDEELEAAAPRKTRTVDVEAFVDAGEIDPILLDRPYYVVPSGDTDGVRRAYRLLHDAMADGGLVALGRLVLRAKEHLVAVGARDGLLTLTTMRFHDEIRPAGDVDNGGRKPSAAKVKAAVAVIEQLACDWDPTRYEDEHRKRLLAAVKRTDRTESVDEDEADGKDPEATPDLMAALTKSLREARGQRDHAKADGTDDLTSLSRAQLYERAQDADVPGRSSMSKAQLVKALS